MRYHQRVRILDIPSDIVQCALLRSWRCLARHALGTRTIRVLLLRPCHVDRLRSSGSFPTRPHYSTRVRRSQCRRPISLSRSTLQRPTPSSPATFLDFPDLSRNGKVPKTPPDLPKRPLFRPPLSRFPPFPYITPIVFLSLIFLVKDSSEEKTGKRESQQQNRRSEPCTTFPFFPDNRPEAPIPTRSHAFYTYDTLDLDLRVHPSHTPPTSVIDTRTGTGKSLKNIAETP